MFLYFVLDIFFWFVKLMFDFDVVDILRMVVVFFVGNNYDGSNKGN